MNIFDEAKIDCHNHLFDPARFPYHPDAPYAPSGQEVATQAQFTFYAPPLQDTVHHGVQAGTDSAGTRHRPVNFTVNRGVRNRLC